VFATPEKYSHCSSLALDWDKVRCPQIVQTILATGADIVCLQEVQLDTWDTDLLPHFQQRNYTCIVQNVKRNHPIACAILLKRDQWNVLAIESRSRALIVVLQERAIISDDDDDTGSRTGFPQTIYIANVHLDARYDQDQTRFNQVKSLLKRMEYHYQQQQPKQLLSNVDTPPIVIIAGDFNMLRTNPLYRLLLTGVYTHPFQSDTLSLHSSLLPLRDIYNDGSDKGDTTKMVTTGQSLSSTKKRLWRTFAGGSILDYIWVSRSMIPDAVPWMMDERCCQPPRKQKYCAWPSMDHPSDHIPIGLLFRL
jgi:mRNA deadenylase 3'-5' endonuclease subunit Ccr4